MRARRPSLNTFFHSATVSSMASLLVGNVDTTIMNLWANALPHLTVYTKGHHYFMVSNAYDWALTYSRSELAEASHNPFIKALLQLGRGPQYFCSADGKTFHQMHLSENQICVDEQETFYDLLSFRTHESDEHHPPCRICFSETRALLLKPEITLDPGEMPSEHQVMVNYTLLCEEEKQQLLLHFLDNKSHLFPLQFRNEPEFLLRNPSAQEYFVATCDHQDYHVKVSVDSIWQELSVVDVEFLGIDGEKRIYFDKESGYHSVYCPGSSQLNVSPYVVYSNQDTAVLMKIEHRHFDYSLIGFLVEGQHPRPTLLDLESVSPSTPFSPGG